MPFVAFLIGTSDWLVLVLLGPAWHETGTIFAWLGVSGLVEPFTLITVWLMMTQGRTRDHLQWGIGASALMSVAVIVGLRWGPLGVAVSYGLVGLFIRTPLLFWFVGREGPVGARDLYNTIAPFAFISCATLLLIFASRQSLAHYPPLISLLLAAGITMIVTVLGLCVLPSGRVVMGDLVEIISGQISLRWLRAK